ncbi:unnamed protein product [Eruca vesicaria subsp. sativa]|uniref:Uncharacterized protein n=1 Tax=Eruca vesicaria subsp. sativa TaxID=29727 RepID=A0ABC8LJ14_ERUVS|nr:unnamed protein product [Eruca vesicaria subsp. sativa]
MGSSKKSQVIADGKTWVIAEISIRASLKPIKTKLRKLERETEVEDEDCCVTPTAKEAKVSEKLICPPAPRKRRPALKCRSNVGVEYFVPPYDLESVFIRRC